MKLKQRINALREQINIRLYDSRERTLGTLSKGSILVAISTIIALVLYHGFELSVEQDKIVGYVVRGSIGYYLIKFLTELLYNFKPRQFLLDRRWEALLMAFLIIDILTINIAHVELLSTFGQFIGIPGLRSGFVLMLQFYVLIIVGLEL